MRFSFGDLVTVVDAARDELGWVSEVKKYFNPLPRNLSVSNDGRLNMKCVGMDVREW